ncbi:MAG: hypothetical protein M1818_002175 [Claussenomyces sp. TS43310]|nr:MAG: hypothetical protein M1818_002175 [Claussenomyces sp. TS43310]
MASRVVAESTEVVALLGVGKWGGLGMYQMLEALTMLDALGIWHTQWASRLLLEAARFWFCSLTCSILLGLWQLYETGVTTFAADKAGKRTGTGERGVREKETLGSEDEARYESLRLERWRLAVRKVIIDACDLLIPGLATGWLRTSPLMVGVAGTVSSLLAAGDIWERVQR